MPPKRSGGGYETSRTFFPRTSTVRLGETNGKVEYPESSQCAIDKVCTELMKKKDSITFRFKIDSPSSRRQWEHTTSLSQILASFGLCINFRRTGVDVWR